MSLLSHCLRTARRKLVLLLLVLIGVLLIGNLAWQQGLLSGEEDPVLHLRKLNQPFNWNSREEEGDEPTGDQAEGGRNSSDYTSNTCRNSLQGKTLVVDDKGYICGRYDLLSSGCCSVNESLGRHDCSGCEPRISCCQQYEYCVSCCLRHEQKPALQQILTAAAENNDVLFVSVSDHYELCLAKCRTSSSSVQHENTYRNRLVKFCYGKDPPPTLGSPAPLGLNRK